MKLDAYLVPAEAWPDCEHRMRSSRSAGEKAFEKDIVEGFNIQERAHRSITVCGKRLCQPSRVGDNQHFASSRPRPTLAHCILTMDDEHQQEDWAGSRINRLPSFTEVLSRRTRPPVDLFMF